MCRQSLCCTASLLTLVAVGSAADGQVVSFREEPGQLHVLMGEDLLGIYTYGDATITRPFFSHVSAPGGPQLTRNHPPHADDPADHAEMHPGMWLAFGDISGNDYWRLGARARHDRFVREPWGEEGRGGFAVHNSYISADGDRVVCTEVTRFIFLERDSGVLVLWDSTFQGDDVCFGDQEEMGLGVRLATPIAESSELGGRILDSAGRVGARDVWGQQAAWCDYSGLIDGQRVGITLMPHPGNFRQCWWHARNYGLLLANPFGRAAFTDDDPSEVWLQEGEPLRLRFGVFLHCTAGEDELDLDAAYTDYLQTAMDD